MQRDYVVQLRPDIDVNAGQFEGRIEQIDSGRSAHFRSIQEFLAFIAASIQPNDASDEISNQSPENVTLL